MVNYSKYLFYIDIVMIITRRSSKTGARSLAFGVFGKFVSAHVCCDTGAGQAYFGNGTKLTVLGKKHHSMLFH